MLWVFVVLLILTALTVWSSNIHEIQFGHSTLEIGGTLHILMALAIAVVKSILVAAYFMHLRYDTPMNTVVVSATIFAVILFIGFTVADSATRGNYAPTEGRVIIEGGSKRQVETAITNAQQAATNPDAPADAADESAPTDAAPPEPPK